MKVALVMTIKNEERLLRNNILYHLGIGISKIYVYLDGTTDNSKATLMGLSNIEICESINPKRYKDRPFLKNFWSQADEHHTARQCLNTYDAQQKCKRDGMHWLISLDADELFLPDSSASVSLEDFFSNIKVKETEVVYFETLEVVSRKIHYNNVMAEETLFKTKKNFNSKLDQIYFDIENPYTGNSSRQSYWLGHQMGKAAIKVDSEVIPKNVHRFQNINGDSPKTIKRGLLLHYHIYDLQDFLKKYENFKYRSTTYLSGNKINGLKALWIKMVNDTKFSEEYLKNYFKRNLLFDKKKTNRLTKSRLGVFWMRMEPAVIEIQVPRVVLSKLT